MRGQALSERSALMGSVNMTPKSQSGGDEDFDEKNAYGHAVGIAFGLNYVIGTGVFSMPFAFYSAGWQIATIGLFVFACMGVVACFYTLEFLARAEGVTAFDELGAASKVAPNSRPVHRIGYRKFDFVRASELFGGLPMKVMAQVCISLYCYGALWSYGAVFSSSATTLFFEYALGSKCDIYSSPSASCHLGYYVVVLAFGVYATLVSLLDVSSQKTLQLAMTWYRFLAFGVMLITVIVSLGKPNTVDPAHAVQHAPYVSTANSHVKWAGLGNVVTFSAVALCVEQNMPDVVQAVRNPKAHLRSMILCVLLIAAGFYVLVGYLCSLAFGAGTIPLATLNWNTYTGRAGGWGHGPTLWWAVIVKLFVMLFPLLNMLSVYPLVCVTLAGNLQNSLSRATAARLTERFSARTVKNAFRLLAAVPPICASLYSGRLNTILSFTGLVGLMLEFVIPTVLHMMSSRLCVRAWGPGSEVTPYSSVFSHHAFGVLILSVTCVTFVAAAFFTYFPSEAAKWL